MIVFIAFVCVGTMQAGAMLLLMFQIICPDIHNEYAKYIITYHIINIITLIVFALFTRVSWRKLEQTNRRTTRQD